MNVYKKFIALLLIDLYRNTTSLCYGQKSNIYRFMHKIYWAMEGQQVKYEIKMDWKTLVYP